MEVLDLSILAMRMICKRGAASDPERTILQEGTKGEEEEHLQWADGRQYLGLHPTLTIRLRLLAAAMESPIAIIGATWTRRRRSRRKENNSCANPASNPSTHQRSLEERSWWKSQSIRTQNPSMGQNRNSKDGMGQ
jgi:hypothetical protein